MTNFGFIVKPKVQIQCQDIGTLADNKIKKATQQQTHHRQL